MLVVSIWEVILYLLELTFRNSGFRDAMRGAMMDMYDQMEEFSQQRLRDPGDIRDGARFLSLVRFYLDCIEEEDLKSLTLRLAQHHRSFISPWDDAEPLFFREAPEVRFKIRNESERRLLTRGRAQVGEAERFFYGYPVFLDQEDFLTPLFVIEVEVSVDSSSDCRMRPIDPHGIQVNYHLFRGKHAGIEDLQLIQDELEREYGSFEARLREAFKHLEIEPPPLDPNRLDPFPSKDLPRRSWINRPVLFRSERSPYTYHLRYELGAFDRYTRLTDSVVETALSPLMELSVLPETPTVRKTPTEQPISIIEVLPLNEQQERCTQESLESPLTVVTGPPGTGKSQIVVNLLASFALAGRPVLFASKNNKAVDVVCDRLRDILGEERNWVLRLGSRRHMDASREEMMNRVGALSRAGRSGSASPFAETDTVSLRALDNEVLALREKLHQLDQVLRIVKLAQHSCREAQVALPPHWSEQTTDGKEFDVPYQLASVGRDEARALCGEIPLGLWLWLKRLILGAGLRRKLRQRLETCIVSLPLPLSKELLAEVDDDEGYRVLACAFERVIAYKRWLDRRREYVEALDSLAELPESSAISKRIQELKERKASLSREFLGTSWTANLLKNRRFVGMILQQYFNLSDKLHTVSKGEWIRAMNLLSDNIRQMGRFLPVWVVTNLSARRSIPLQPGLFDLVIIDEASQCDIASAIPLLFRAKRALIIGDPHQLRHISTIRERREAQLARDRGVEALLGDWSYTRRSLYDAAEVSVRRQGKEPLFLSEHYRSHPRVIEFSNRTFYRGRLVLRTDVARLEQRLNGQPLGIFWHNVDGRVPDTFRSAKNEAEVGAIMGLLQKWWELDLLSRSDVRVGVVTPFRLQMEAVERALEARHWWESVQGRVVVGTAHRFQGDECDAMIFSPVVAPGMRERLRRWVAETDQLLNVAITRARGALHIVGSLDACSASGKYLAGLADYVTSGATETQDAFRFDSQAEELMVELLEEMGLWYQPQYHEGRHRFDFLVVSPFGYRYDLEVDGRGHWTSEQLYADEVRDKAIEALGYRVIRIIARDLFLHEDLVRALLARIK